MGGYTSDDDFWAEDDVDDNSVNDADAGADDNADDEADDDGADDNVDWDPRELEGSLSTCVNKYLEAGGSQDPRADHKIFIATNTNICHHTDYIFVTQNRN